MERRESGAPGQDHLAALAGYRRAQFGALGWHPAGHRHAARIPHAGVRLEGRADGPHPISRRCGHRPRRHAGEASRGRNLQRQDLRHSDRHPWGLLAHQSRPLGKAGLLDADGKPTLPSSLSEFETACKKIKAAGGGAILGSGDDDVVSTGWVWASLYAQFGGKAFDDQGMPSVDTPEALMALQTMLKLRADGCLQRRSDRQDLRGLHQRQSRERDRGHVAGQRVGCPGRGSQRCPQELLRGAHAAARNSARHVGRIAHVRRAAGHQRRPGARQGGPPVHQVLLGPQRGLDTNRRFDHPSIGSGQPRYQALPHHTEYLAYADQAVYNPQTLWAAGYDAVLQEEVTSALLGTKTPEQALQDMQSRLTDAANFM